MGFCVGAYALERWLGLNCFSFSLSLGSRLLQQGPPLLLMSSFRRAMPEPPIYRRSNTKTLYPKIHLGMAADFFRTVLHSINYLQLFIHEEEDV